MSSLVFLFTMIGLESGVWVARTLLVWYSYLGPWVDLGLPEFFWGGGKMPEIAIYHDVYFLRKL